MSKYGTKQMDADASNSMSDFMKNYTGINLDTKHKTSDCANDTHQFVANTNSFITDGVLVSKYKGDEQVLVSKYKGDEQVLVSKYKGDGLGLVSKPNEDGSLVSDSKWGFTRCKGGSTHMKGNTCCNHFKWSDDEEDEDDTFHNQLGMYIEDFSLTWTPLIQTARLLFGNQFC